MVDGADATKIFVKGRKKKGKILLPWATSLARSDYKHLRPPTV